MSGYIRDQNRSGIVPLFTPELVEQIERSRSPGLKERADRLLTACIKQVGYTTDIYDFVSDMELQAVSFSSGPAQMRPLLQILDAEGTMKNDNGFYHLTPRGYLVAEEALSPTANSSQAFVAMSFDPSMDDSYTHGFEPAIRLAGYRSLRIDRKEHVNSISDEILSEIRRSRFVVADYTQMNNGVYFEAGFAMGLGLTVVPTCRADFAPKLHFDIRHINTLIWNSPEHLCDALTKRISAVVGDGPLVP